MKNLLRTSIFAAAVALSAMASSVHADTSTSAVLDNNFYCDGVRYTVYEVTTKTSTKPVVTTISYTATVTSQLSNEYNYVHLAGEVNIPETIVCDGHEATVTEIDASAFARNTTITKVTLPSTLATLGSSAFANMTALEEVYFAESELTALGSGLFTNCTALKRVDFPSNIETWTSGNCFNGCTSLKSVNFPANSKLATISGSYAFSGCTALKTFTFPASVTKISAANMFDKSSVETVVFADNTNREGVDMTDVANRLAFTGSYLFNECPSLRTVVFPTYINYFGSKTNLAGTTCMFANCPELRTVVFPEGCTLPLIPGYFMTGCTGIATVKLPEGITGIGQYAFSGCTSLRNITVPETVTKIDTYAFNGCTALTKMELHEGITSIGAAAFYGCSGLTSVKLPGTIKNIPDNIFQNCTSLTDVALTPGPTTIGTYAFRGCTALKSIVIPEGVTYFRTTSGTATTNSSPFYECPALEYIVLPSTFHGSGYILSKGMTSLKAIVSRSTTPVATSTTTVDDLFNTVKIYVPNEEVIAKYTSLNGWKNFAAENYAVSGLFSLPETATLYLNEKRALDASTVNQVDPLIEALGIVWTSDDDTKVSIDANGMLVANAITDQPVTVTGKYWGNPLTCAVTVVANPYQMTMYDVTLNPGQTLVMDAHLALNQNATAGMEIPVNPSIVWSTANPEIASVNENGMLTANKLGKTTLTAEYRGETRTVNVSIQPEGELQVTDNVTIKQGETLQLKPVMNTELALVDVDPAHIKWSVEVNGGYKAFVDGTGTLFGASEGTATVTADYYGKTASFLVTVLPGEETQVKRYTLIVNMPEAYGQVHLVNAPDGTVMQFEAHNDGHINSVRHDDNEVTHTIENGRYIVNNPDKPNSTVTVKFDR